MSEQSYRFGPQGADGHSSMAETLGGKGANLCEMANLGMPVPPGLILPTSICLEYFKAADKDDFMHGVMEVHVKPFLQDILAQYGYMPLFSVRSGAQVSMPGMMDTLLNVGLGSYNLIKEWKWRLGEEAALDCRKRQIEMFHKVLNKSPAAELPGQLQQCIEGVFNSWNSPRAKHYRKMHGYSDDWGTACIIQVMVFGNIEGASCSGVMFTRCPSTGMDTPMGDFLPNAQGEDVVAGTHDTYPIGHLVAWSAAISDQLNVLAESLEVHYKHPQDIEFTVQDGDLYILQTRNAKMSTKAEFRAAWDMYEEKLISKKEMLGRVSARKYLLMRGTRISPDSTAKPVATGKGTGGAVVRGRAMFPSASAVNCKDPCILMCAETTPEDIAGMEAAVGILTATGGETSHAAVVARGLNKTCVVGCTSMGIEAGEAGFHPSNVSCKEGDEIVINGETGDVYVGDLPELEEIPSDSYAEQMINLVSRGKNIVGIGTSWEDNIDGMLLVPLSKFDVLSDDEFAKGLTALVKDVSKVPGWENSVVFDLMPTFMRSNDLDVWMQHLTTMKSDDFAYLLKRNAAMLAQVVLELGVGPVWVTSSKSKAHVESDLIAHDVLKPIVLDMKVKKRSELAFEIFGG